jgi:hypothetical protein
VVFFWGGLVLGGLFWGMVLFGYRFFWCKGYFRARDLQCALGVLISLCFILYRRLFPPFLCKNHLFNPFYRQFIDFFSIILPTDLEFFAKPIIFFDKDFLCKKTNNKIEVFL